MLIILETTLGVTAALIQILLFIYEWHNVCVKKVSKRLWGIATFVMVGLLIKSGYQNYQLEQKDRIIEYKENVSRQARAILQETIINDAAATAKYMAFLESHKDIFPDAYKRMSDLGDKMDIEYSVYHGSDDLIPAAYVREMVEGTVRGIAAIN